MGLLTRRLASPYASAAWVLAIVVGALYVVPLLQLVAQSMYNKDGFTLSAYTEILSSTPLRNVLLTTARLCLTVTAISLLLSFVLALAIVHAKGIWQHILTVCVIIPFWLSVLVRAMAWLILLRNNGVINSALLDLGIIEKALPLARNETGVIIGMVHFCMPFAILPLVTALRGFDGRLVQASLSLGASRWHTFYAVLLPVLMPSIIAAGVLVYIISLGFLVIPAILGGGKVVMASEYISLSVLQTVNWPMASAFSVILLVTTLILVGIVAKLTGPKKVAG